MIPRRFAYSRMPAYPGLEPGLPVIPFTLTYQGKSCTIQAIVDSDASINVLPYNVGAKLGLIWEIQTFFFQEFDVVFSGSQQIFEIAPKGVLLQST
ncbi:hypothetical protein U27_00490 [Candidatus Vecturithrix granuli]|uniref:Retroviral aspartyl protease n=1 Tax=Vecturithrix granuli TaxID=1499967 RepID=A0A081C7N8_VECG1|nr:hypothetical protein U27_00490 [Candidatus Vecturithrix granuli]